MKHTTSGFNTDKLILTPKDIWSLILGNTLKGNGLNITFKWWLK